MQKHILIRKMPKYLFQDKIKNDQNLDYPPTYSPHRLNIPPNIATVPSQCRKVTHTQKLFTLFFKEEKHHQQTHQEKLFYLLLAPLCILYIYIRLCSHTPKGKKQPIHHPYPLLGNIHHIYIYSHYIYSHYICI